MLTLIRSLAPLFYKYRWTLVAGVLFLIISNLFAIYPAQVVRDAFNLVADLVRHQQLVRGFQAEDELHPTITLTLLWFGFLVLLLAVLRGFFLFLVRQTLIVMSRKMEFDQKNQLFDHFQGLSLSILRRNQTGDLMARITEDISNVRMFTGPGIMYTLNTVTLFVLVMTTMFVVNAELTLYCLAPLPLMALSIYWVHSIINKRSEEASAQLSVMSSLSQEAFSGIRLLRAYGKESTSSGQFRAASEVYQTKAMRLARIDAVFYPLIMLLSGLSTIIVLWVGGEKVADGTFTIGAIAEFMIYVTMLTFPMAMLGWITSMIQKGAASQKRINEVLAQRSEVQFPESSAAVAQMDVRFVDVNFTYADTGIAALQQINFHAPPGTVLGIVGATGCGKSTLANLLPRLMDTTNGQILIDGQPIGSYTEEALRGQIGYVPQDVFLFSDTIANNIAFGAPQATEADIVAAAEFAGVYEDIMRLPEGMQTIIGERGVTLSGGQKQRLSIARAFIRKPKLLIFDDALSAVDTRTEARILSNLRNQLQQAAYDPTVVIISHRISAVDHADKILVLAHGRIVEEGTHTSLVAQNGYYADLYQKQLLEEEIVTH